MVDIIKTVGVVIIQDNSVLLVRHETHAGHVEGVYGLPAGRIALNESLEEAVIRELKEETGLITGENDLVEISGEWKAEIVRKGGETETFSIKPFLCLSFEGEIKESAETTPVWIPLDKITEYRLLPNIKEIIDSALEIMFNKKV